MALQQTKEYLAIIGFLKSFETVSVKIDVFLRFQTKQPDTLLETIKQENSHYYDLAIEESYSFLKNNLQCSTQKVFAYLAKMHYTINNGKVYICNNTLQEYQLLSSSIDINPLMASYILDYTDRMGSNNRLRFIDNSFDIDFKFYGDIEKRFDTYSDLHLHLGGALPFESRLHYLLKDTNSLKLSLKNQKLFADIGCNLKVADIIYSASVLENMLIELYVQDKFKSKEAKETIKSINKDLVDFLALLKGRQAIRKYVHYRKYNTVNMREGNQVFLHYSFGESFSDVLLSKMFQAFQKKEIRRADRYLMLFLVDKLQQEDNYAKVIEIYLVLRNIIKNFIVQQHQREGLGYFSIYSQSTIRRSQKRYEKALIVEYLLHKNFSRNIEGRISPSKNAKNILQEIKEYIDDFENKNTQKSHLKFIFHFQKSEDKSVATIKKKFQMQTKKR